MNNSELTKEDGLTLIQHAYQTIAEHLGKPASESEVNDVREALTAPVFNVAGGTFVTLKKLQNLRGCIGTLVSDKTIAEGVRSNALNAAFNDYRFKPLTADELKELEVEVSVLSTPETLEYKDWQELVTKIQVGTDGVILRKGSASATFLPQVWQQLPHPESFLSQLALKAGLPEDAWKTGSTDIETYQVQSFSRTF
nr:AmmeMemoRadiSam system protein A [Desulfobulbaceae bacterium]